MHGPIAEKQRVKITKKDIQLTTYRIILLGRKQTVI